MLFDACYFGVSCCLLLVCLFVALRLVALLFLMFVDCFNSVVICFACCVGVDDLCRLY